ncbi:MAG: VPLPA-CTERM-specific exosortase XrtD [Pseudomonadota bacterium]
MSTVSEHPQSAGPQLTVTQVQWLVMAVAAAVIYWLFRDGIDLMVAWWGDKEEYSHGYMIPLISGYLIWQRSDELRGISFNGSWLGVLIAILGLCLLVLGELSTIYTIIQYAFLVTLYGVALAFLGWRAFKVVAMPLFILFFMVPLPNFIYNNLSAELQLISSQLGVLVIRAFDISVFLQGNVIDLGSYQLQVVEACNGLRYLFPLMTLGFIVAYFFKAPFWKRLVLFLSTIPITVLMNSFRIGVIGVLVEHWGESMAEGFLHDFEGWVVFMACFGVLFVEMILLMRVTRDKRSLGDAFAIESPRPFNPEAEHQARPMPKTMGVALGVMIVLGFPLASLSERAEDVPPRDALARFPHNLESWSGSQDVMEQQYIDALKFSDYLLANYRGTGKHDGLVNLYVAYYGSQRKGESVHSPKSCLPGGGWQIESLSDHVVEGVAVDQRPLVVNRALISHGEQKQLVYYWFQQRGRVITNEYLVKWYIFWDSLTRNRTDGALVRLITKLDRGQDVAEAEAALTDFARRLSAQLPGYVPS